MNILKRRISGGRSRRNPLKGKTMSKNYTAAVFWSSFAAIAALRGQSISALAIDAGMDASALNPSKSQKNGKDRWPSMETVAKVCETAGLTSKDWRILTDFLADFNERNPAPCPNQS